MDLVIGKMALASIILVASNGVPNAMQNPLFSGVNRLEIFCPQTTTLTPQQQKLMCGLLQAKASSKFGFPANIHLNQSGMAKANGLNTGYLELVLHLENATDKKIEGKLSWRNAKPMLGVDRNNDGKIVSLIRTADMKKDLDSFIDKLLETMPL